MKVWFISQTCLTLRIVIFHDLWSKGTHRGDFITKGFEKVFLPKGFLALFGAHKDFWQSICHETTNLVKGFSGVFHRFSCPFYLKSFEKDKKTFGHENLWKTPEKPLTKFVVSWHMDYQESFCPQKWQENLRSKGTRKPLPKVFLPFFPKASKKGKKTLGQENPWKTHVMK